MNLKKNILFFSPFQNVWQHSFPERKLAEILEDTNSFNISFLGCNSIFSSYCLAMSNLGLNINSNIDQKKKACESCQKMCSKTWNTNNKFYIDNYITNEDKKTVSSLLNDLTKENIKEFQFQDVPIGKIAPYELLLNHKLSTIENLSDEIWSEYLSAVGNCLYTLIALEKFLLKNKIDSILLYNTNYGINHTVKLTAQKYSIQTICFHYSLELNNSGDYFFLTTDIPYIFLNRRKEFFEKNKQNLNIQYSESNRIFEYINHLFGSKNFWVYSEKKQGNTQKLYDTFKINKNSSVALMSLSSMDELYGLELCIANKDYIEKSNLLFKNQFKWIDETIEFFTKYPEWKLIIRIHPREFPNRRENVTSEISKKYFEIIDRLPNNIFINRPDQKVSIYDLMSIVKVHLTSWSSVGLESSLMGVPTISITQGISLYPNKFINHFPESIEEYHSLIFKFMTSPFVRSFNYYNNARDWLLYDFIQSTIEMKSNGGLKQKPTILKRILYKLKLININSFYDYKSYANKVTISEAEIMILKEFFNTLKPIYEIKQKNLNYSESKTQVKKTNENELLKELGIIFNTEIENH